MSAAVGQSVPRIDGADKVTGRGVYASDVKLSGMAHAKILRSPVASRANSPHRCKQVAQSPASLRS